MSSLVLIEESDLIEIVGGKKRKRRRRRKTVNKYYKNNYNTLDDRDYITINVDESSSFNVGGSLIIMNDNDGNNQANVDSAALLSILQHLFPTG